MKLLPLVDVLGLHQLQHPTLYALQATEAQYTVLVLQPEGNISVSETSIGHADSASAQASLSAFLSLAARAEPTPDLVVAPEYSIPWEVLLHSIESGVVPSAGKLWALGCESIPLGMLDQFRARLGDRAVIIDSAPDLSKVTTQRYLNPLVYVFWAPRVDQCDRLVLLVQYKTKVSGDGHNTEAIGMLPGEVVYLFGRQPEEIRLLTLICSDAFDFRGDLVKGIYQGLLVLHIQLNNNPRHPLYKPYRKELFQYAGDTELLCVNWAANVKLSETAAVEPANWKNIAGSAWYLRAPEIDRSDEFLHANQCKGLYYTRYEPLKVDALLFHYSPKAFLLQSTKVLHHGVIGAASYRTGPHVISAFDWSSESAAWEPVIGDIDDGFSSIVGRSSGGLNLDEWSEMHAANPVDVERMLAICAGAIGPATNWHDVTKLDSMRMCEEEVMWRTTVDLDPRAAEFRSHRFSAGRMLSALKAEGFDWPVEVGFLKSGFKLSWSQQYPHRNVQAESGVVATVIYAGAIGDPRHLESVDSQARRALAHIPEPDRMLNTEEEKIAHRRYHESLVPRLCILYQDGTKISAFRNSREKNISSPSNGGVVSITTPSRVPTEPDTLKSIQ